MKLLSILGVVLLLSVVELEATSVSEVRCPERNLSVTADDQLRLYVDGIEITNLTNATIWNQPDVVDLPCTTRLIAIRGSNEQRWRGGGILASTGDNYVLTDSSWKCSNVGNSGWEGIDFDDSSWMPAVEFGRNEKFASQYPFQIPGISTLAEWIWTRQKETNEKVYCRKRIDINECLLGAPHSECNTSMGECINLFGGYNCSCYEGYTNDGSKRCKVSTSSCSTSSTIFGVFLGVSVLANIALISALWVLHLRKKREENKDNNEGESGVGNVRHSNGDAARNSGTDPAHYEYPS